MPTALAALGVSELRKIFRSSASALPSPTKGEMTGSNWRGPTGAG
jgi:hypothetical protein